MSPEDSAAVRYGSVLARWAMALLLGAVLLRLGLSVIGLDVPGTRAPVCSMNPCPDTSRPISGVVRSWIEAGIQLVPIVAFLTWVRRAARNTRTLGRSLSVTPDGAVATYFVPFVNLVEPCRAMVAIHELSDPMVVAERPIAVRRAVSGYRDAGQDFVAAPRWAYAAPILGWWVAFLARSFPLMWFVQGTAAVVATHALDVGAAVLACMVIRSVDARQQELRRRLEAAADERTGEPPPPAPAIA
jgi:hypothetical protein